MERCVGIVDVLTTQTNRHCSFYETAILHNHVFLRSVFVIKFVVRVVLFIHMQYAYPSSVSRYIQPLQ